MGFKTGAYAKIWQVTPRSETVTELRISTSRKNKDSGEYEQDFGGYVRCVGTACAAKAASLAEGDKIRIGDVEVTRRYDKEAQKEYTNFTVFSFEKDDGSPPETQSNTQTRKTAEPAGTDGATDTLPF